MEYIALMFMVITLLAAITAYFATRKPGGDHQEDEHKQAERPA